MQLILFLSLSRCKYFFATIVTGHFPMESTKSSNHSSWETKMSIELMNNINNDNNVSPLSSNRRHRRLGEITWRKREDYYKILNSIGKGSFGQVVLAVVLKSNTSILYPETYKRGTLMEPLKDSMYRVHTLVAIKIMKKQMTNYNRVKEVICINAIPSHSALVQIFDIFIDSTTGQLHIVMETMNQNLYQLMSHRKHTLFSSDTLKSILTQLLSAIRHIHRHDYFHRDVKPENILVIPTFQYYGDKANIPPYRDKDSYIIKLADYGLARHIDDQRPYTEYVATRWYRSPEILLRKKWYSKPCDIWAFGTIAIELTNVAPLFPGKNELDQIGRILSVLGNPIPPSDSNLSNHVRAPLGGYWKEAYSLSKSLGIELLHTDGLKMQDIIPYETHHDLAKVAKACLTWDPVTRADVETLCAMSYFKGTCLATKYVEPERIFTSTNPNQLLNDHSNPIANTLGDQTLNKSLYNSDFCPYSSTDSYVDSKIHSPMEKLKPLRIFEDIDDGYEYEFQSTNGSELHHNSYNLMGEFNLSGSNRDNYDHPNSNSSDYESIEYINDQRRKEEDEDGNDIDHERLLNSTIEKEPGFDVSVSSSVIREYLAVPSQNGNYSYPLSESYNINNNNEDAGNLSDYWRSIPDTNQTESQLLKNMQENEYTCITLLSQLCKEKDTTTPRGNENENNTTRYDTKLQQRATKAGGSGLMSL